MSSYVAKDGAEVSLRRMNAGDVTILFEWQCHPSARRFARNPQPPELEGHKKWFAARLASTDCILAMILHGGQPAGMLRFDRGSDDAWEVSILIAPEKAHMGIGSVALALGRELAPSAVLVAEILPGNEASVRLFQRSGYVRGPDGLYRSTPISAR